MKEIEKGKKWWQKPNEPAPLMQILSRPSWEFPTTVLELDVLIDIAQQQQSITTTIATS